MKVLVLGAGGREHAIAWKLSASPQVTHVAIAPGNAGWHTCFPVNLSDIDALTKVARDFETDLIIVGPEQPIADGTSDALRAEGFKVFAPSQAAGRLESSKSFAKEVMHVCGVPTARYRVFTALEPALNFVHSAPWPFVIKADGLAGGKGVWLPDGIEDAEGVLRQLFEARILGSAGDVVVIEERLFGPEVSVFFASDGAHVLPLLPCRDYKRLHDGDAGPNTGGMGAISPVPGISDDMLRTLCQQIALPVLSDMKRRGTPYIGILYAGLILCEDGPKVLEFNIRLGDPETQALLPLLRSDLYELFTACLAGTLSTYQIEWHPGSASTVVLASAGYPGTYLRGQVIQGLTADDGDTQVFLAGTNGSRNTGFSTNGGRVLSVTGLGTTLSEALDVTYARCASIEFEGHHYRRDIGARVDS